MAAVDTTRMLSRAFLERWRDVLRRRGESHRTVAAIVDFILGGLAPPELADTLAEAGFRARPRSGARPASDGDGPAESSHGANGQNGQGLTDHETRTKLRVEEDSPSDVASAPVP